MSYKTLTLTHNTTEFTLIQHQLFESFDTLEQLQEEFPNISDNSLKLIQKQRGD